VVTSHLQLVHRDAVEFFWRVSLSSRPGLLLDYDGTIAPFCIDRGQANPYPEVGWLLQRIQDETNTRLVMISGRSARELRSLLVLSPAPEIWGTHGLERLWPDGSYQLAPLDGEQLRALISAQRTASGRYGSFLEHKPGALALHWRGLGPEMIDAVREFGWRSWQPIADQSGLLLAEFDGGLELRLPSHNKGDAVHRVLQEIGDSGVCAYLGDDKTDEDAFVAVRRNDLPVLVRTAFRDTAAKMWIKPPEGLLDFLSEWLRACGGVL
jgi:trehalose 6-phosphate phosphatase